MTDSDTSSNSDSLDQLASGVVLGGRYSLKDRVPRWIAERRFKAREMESGEIVAVLIWSDSVPWIDEFLALAAALPTNPFRTAERIQGFWVIVTDWRPGMREATGEAETAQEVLDQLRKFSPRAATTLPPPRVRKTGDLPVTENAQLRKRPNGDAPLPEPAQSRKRVAPPLGPSAIRTNSLVDWIGLGIALASVILIGWFTFQWIAIVREPLRGERPAAVALSPSKPERPKPTESAKPSAKLIEVQTLRKNGNASSALVLLLDLDARSPGNVEIQAEMTSLLKSLDDDLENLRSGVRPALVRSIDRAAESGNAEAIRLRDAIVGTPESSPTPSEPLPIR